VDSKKFTDKHKKKNMLSTILKRSGLIAVLFLAIACEDKQRVVPDRDMSETDFIYLQGKSFMHKKDTFFPLMLNYVTTFRTIDGGIVASPIKEYENHTIFETNTKEDALYQLSGHFQLIREMGFNAMRICFDRIGQDEQGKYFYRSQEEDKRYYIENDYDAIFEGLQQIVDIAFQNDLRIMLLIKCPLDNKDLEEFTARMLKRFQDNPTIFAYDFMNEPLYFDPDPDRKKEDAVKIVSSWKEMMQKYAPNQLFTIGFSEPIEVFEWDSEMLPVDFVQIHTYHPLRVKSETYWYANYIHKPWMIGETGLSADNDSISYESQRQFFKELYEFVRDCGGSGFGWWEFQDIIPTDHYESKYSGLLSHQGKTITKDGKHTILGSLKPAVDEIAHFSEYRAAAMKRPINYYNMLGYNNFRIKGIVLDEKTKKPVEGAAVRGWNEDWSIGMNTFTNAKGEFTLYCNDPCVHFEISAPGMTQIKFSKNIPFDRIAEKAFDINNLPGKEIEYQSIPSNAFLKDSAKSIFDIDSSLFNQAKYEGDIGLLYLNRIIVEDSHGKFNFWQRIISGSWTR
jgi:hypothetical protein